MSGAVLALLSAAGFGVSDFSGGLAARRVPALRVVLVSYPVALVLLGSLAIVVGGPIPAGAIGWGLASGVALGLGGWWFYAALGSGPLSVVSPVSAVLAAAVPVVIGLIQGERPGLVAASGIVLALLAVALVSREATDEDVRPHRFTRKVAWLTVGTGLAFGLDFVFIHEAPADSGLWPLAFARVAAAVLVLAAATGARELRLPSGGPLKLALLAGLADAAANVAMLLALRGSDLSLVSVLISLFPAVTVVLAIVVLRERVHRGQVLGMVLAGVAVVMITAG
ncbi:EamA family transporter [Mycolicibacter longobardus]|uniref:EamA family transporter n=1 Tax=Mycolicibacter longobardus TaxID=1108812 RepID=UPI000D6A7D21|nr:EamA family transporter [Mycolicibacter longobardus]MCV7383869.1 EamA family transporter [Mycolicibacter longobardus]